jgi:hypothetical protein
MTQQQPDGGGETESKSYVYAHLLAFSNTKNLFWRSIDVSSETNPCLATYKHAHAAASTGTDRRTDGQTGGRAVGRLWGECQTLDHTLRWSFGRTNTII